MKRKMQYKAQKRVQGVRWVPSLPLSGVWLEKAGFKVGQEVQIVVEEGKVVIYGK